MNLITIEKSEDLLRSDLCSDGNMALAIGFFDGVHTAHRELLQKTKEYAKREGLTFGVFTFTGAGMENKGKGRLYTDKEKCELLESLGAQTVILCKLGAVRELSGEAFVTDVLFKKLSTRAIFCGYDFRFGKGAESGVSELSRYAEACGAGAFIIPEVSYEGRKISSSYIKELIEKKNVRKAARLLSLPYFISGVITHGKGIGTGMGLPTVNISLPIGRISPPRGVYSTVTRIKGRNYPSLTNIGSCPTFGERDIHSETFILDFDGDVYDEKVKVYFIDYLRDERTFSGQDELIKQINVDKIRAKELLGDIKWQEIGQS